MYERKIGDKKRYPIKLVNQGNLDYSDKPANQVNPIERQNKKKQITKPNSQQYQY
jgi:hypothetical protein